MNSPIKKAIARVRAFMAKSPLGSEVHVDAPLGSEEKICKDDGINMNPPVNNLDIEIAHAALAAEGIAPSTPKLPPPAPAGGKSTSPATELAPPALDEIQKDALDSEERNRLHDSTFAIPSERKYPINNISHARNALARSSGKPEQAKVRAAVYAKYPSLKPKEKKAIAKSDANVKPEPRRVARVLVRHGEKVLMGKRRDNEKWTTPGGHADPGEDLFAAALRELKEETGLDLSHEAIRPLTDVKYKTDMEGLPLYVQAFIIDLLERPSTTMLSDPDAEVERWRWIDIGSGLPQHISDNLHTPAEDNVLAPALKIQVQKSAVKKDDTEPEEGDDNAFSDLAFMGQIINGMDYESKMGTALDADVAREIALTNLADDPDYYRKKWLEIDETDDPINKDTQEGEESPFLNTGINLDLGSGHAREPCHIGLDTYPFDYGTLVHDLTLGIPFPDSCATKVRLVNAMEDMDFEDPKALLSEIERVLMPGGEFYYEGPNAIQNSSEGLKEKLNISGIAKDSNGIPGWSKQVFTRVSNPDAATSDDTEPRTGVAQWDNLPADALLAVDALGYYWSDATSSGLGNRLHGYPSQAGVQKTLSVVKKSDDLSKHQVLRKRVPILKADKPKQIVYCIVLAPEELDMQDDFMLADDIEETAHDYLLNSRVIGSDHSKAIEAAPVESYIAPVDFSMEGQYGPQEVKKGSWILGIKIFDPGEWSKIEDGSYTGVSVGGFGLRDKM